MSLKDLIQKANAGKVMVIAPTKGSGAVAPSSTEVIRKKFPELVEGYYKPGTKEIRENRTFWERTIGEVKELYLSFFADVTPSDAAWILKNTGATNRQAVAAREAEYVKRQKDGTWGGWSGNTALFTVDNAGEVLPSAFHQTNAGHSMRAQLKSGATVTYLFGFGIPVERRGLVDDNSPLRAKDTLSRHDIWASRINEFLVDGEENSTVKITPALEKSMLTTLSESARIVQDTMSGHLAKSGGKGMSNEELEEFFNEHGEALRLGVERAYLLDKSDGLCNHTKTKKDGTQVAATSGGLSARFDLHHISAIYALVCGGEEWDADSQAKLDEFFAIAGDDRHQDTTSPPVVLRKQFEFWKTAAPAKASSFQNIKFVAMKAAILDFIEGKKVTSNRYSRLQATDCLAEQYRLGGLDNYKPEELPELPEGAEEGIDDGEPSEE